MSFERMSCGFVVFFIATFIASIGMIGFVIWAIIKVMQFYGIV